MNNNQPKKYKLAKQVGRVQVGTIFEYDNVSNRYRSGADKNTGENMNYSFSYNEVRTLPDHFVPMENEPSIEVTFSKKYEFNLKEIKGSNDAMKRHNAYMMAMDMLIEEIPEAEFNSELFEYTITNSQDKQEDTKGDVEEPEMQLLQRAYPVSDALTNLSPVYDEDHLTTPADLNS